MKDYRAFRDLLEKEDLAYRYRNDPDRYDIYRGFWARSKDFVVSVPAQVARRNVAEAHDLIRTALDLQNLFGS